MRKRGFPWKRAWLCKIPCFYIRFVCGLNPPTGEWFLLKAFGYARVSTASENIENQIQAIERFARENGYELLKVFTDIGVSGAEKALEREGFKQLLTASSLLDVKTIIIYDLSRLGRDFLDLIYTYKYLVENGFTVLFVKHPELNIRSDTPLGEVTRKAILSLLSVLAEVERVFIRERTREGLERARRMGVRLGRKPVEIPWDKVEELRRMKLSYKAIWRLLINMGYLKYREKGVEKTLSYDRFLKRVKKEHGSRET